MKQEIEIKEGCTRLVVDFEKRTVVQEFEKEFIPKNGDFCTTPMGSVIIYNCPNTDNSVSAQAHNAYIGLTRGVLFEDSNYTAIRLATASERQQLLDALAKEGKTWNAELKRIEKIRWRAEIGESYWSSKISPYEGDIEYKPIPIIEKGGKLDNTLYNQGDYFQTESECQALCDELNAVLEKRRNL